MTLKHQMEIFQYFEKAEINNWDKFRFLSNSSKDRANDFRTSSRQHPLVKDWRKDLNAEQFLLQTNYYTETLRVYRQQDSFYSRIKNKFRS